MEDRSPPIFSAGLRACRARDAPPPPTACHFAALAQISVTTARSAKIKRSGSAAFHHCAALRRQQPRLPHARRRSAAESADICRAPIIFLPPDAAAQRRSAA